MLCKVIVISKSLSTQGAWITHQLPTVASLQCTNLIEWLVKCLMLHDKKELLSKLNI